MPELKLLPIVGGSLWGGESRGMAYTAQEVVHRFYHIRGSFAGKIASDIADFVVFRAGRQHTTTETPTERSIPLALYRTLSLVLLTGSVALTGVLAASASAAKVRLSCGLPYHGVVSCRLAGSGFHAREHLRITYRVEFTALPLVHGTFPTKVYHRDAHTDAAGAFHRPPLGFAVVKYHESYRLTATARGDRGDHAAVTLVAIAQ